MSHSSVVLVLAELSDQSARDVVAVLRRRGIRTRSLDTADFPQWLGLTAYPGSAGSRGYLEVDGERVDLGAVRAVYRRGPKKFRFPENMSDPEHRFAMAEATQGVGGVLAGLNCRWVDHPARVADASYKPVQLVAAADCGFVVPRTIVTNIGADARLFIDELGGTAVYKPLSPGVLGEEGRLKILNTTLVGRDTIDDTAIGLTAHLFQQWVPKRHDVRLTMVNGRPFAVAIHTDSPVAYVDWRTDYDSLTYLPVETPESVRRAAVAYLRRFGLRFGAFDFSVDNDGTWWFLECNPNGQWGWLAAACDLPIADAIADALLEEQ